VEPTPINVTVVTLAPSDLTEEVALTGRLELWVEVDVSTELGGTIQEIGFEKGQRVEAGQVLARVGTDIFTVDLDEAEAALIEAEANYERSRELLDRQAVPRQELVTYTSRYRMAEARVKAARLRFERSIVKAPVSGIAVTRLVDVGEVVPPLSGITTIHQVARLKANVGIPETDISHFRVGGEASVEVDAYPGKQFDGRIHFIGSAATGKNRTFPSEVALDNRSGELRPGMIAPVSLIKRRYQGVVVIPQDALLDREDGSVAFVAEGDYAKVRPVVLGPTEGDRIVVLEGLTTGERLVVSGHRNLVDGQPVRVVE
jgi:membrane fusion protein (multidrug efflux system)